MSLGPALPLDAGAATASPGANAIVRTGLRTAVTLPALQAWRARAPWRRPGALPLAIGSLALLAAAVLGLLLVPRWQADARADARALHQRALAASALAARPARAADPGPAQRLRAALPPADQTPLRVAELLALAQRHDLTVQSARQSAPAAVDAPAAPSAAPSTAASTSASGATRPAAITAVPLAWRAQGRYADLRAFVAAALQADTGLVLDQLRLSRADGRAALLDADLQWQLLLQADTPPANPALRPAP